MGRLGLIYVTAIMTLMSAMLSAFIAWLFSFAINVPNYNVHIFLAFVIPFFVTPIFSYLSALSMRDLQRARRKAVDLARLDMLTGLGNRRAFFDTARKLTEDPSASSAGKGVLYIDVDHFKSINDRYGHEGGDVVLKHFADLLRSCTRSSDLVARLGGEEFAVHAVDIEPAGLAAIANGLIARVRCQRDRVRGQPHPLHGEHRRRAGSRLDVNRPAPVPRRRAALRGQARGAERLPARRCACRN